MNIFEGASMKCTSALSWFYFCNKTALQTYIVHHKQFYDVINVFDLRWGTSVLLFIRSC